MKRHDEALAPSLLYKLERGGIIGYLELDSRSAPVKIGAVDSPEFKLVESLFDAPGSDARNRSMKHEIRRVYAKATGHPAKFNTTPRIYNRLRATLNEIIQELRTTQAGKYLSFTQGSRYMAMSIHGDRRFV